MDKPVAGAAIIVVAIVIAVLVFHFDDFFSPMPGSTTLAGFPTANVTFVHNGIVGTYYVYVADTPQLQALGYMYANSTGNCMAHSPCLGMVFPFSNYSSQCFWMKNTRIPLRQTWFNRSGYAVYIYNATPNSTLAVCQYGSFVLETNINQSISIGDRLAFG